MLIIAMLAGLAYQRAAYNLNHIDYRNANFVFFWLSGRMIISGENPYDTDAWLASHDAHDVSWRPNLIFPYPLPLALLLVPLGLLPLDAAYLVWQLLSAAVIMGSVWALLARRKDARYRRLLVPLVIFLLFFGPVLVSLQIGALGPLTLGIMILAIRALDEEHFLPAGVALSLTLLKPPQGAPILLLVCIWLAARRYWMVLTGIGLGAIALALMGLALDPHWIPKFLTAGGAVLDRTLGLQSNAIGLAHLACAGMPDCTRYVGGITSILVLGAVGVFMWRRASSLEAWEVFSIVIPAGFVSTLYLWSYDQVLYIIPIVGIVMTLIHRQRSYWAAFAFLACLFTVSTIAVVIQANNKTDHLSILNTLLVVSAYIALRASRGEDQAATNAAFPAADSASPQRW